MDIGIRPRGLIQEFSKSVTHPFWRNLRRMPHYKLYTEIGKCYRTKRTKILRKFIIAHRDDYTIGTYVYLHDINFVFYNSK